MTRQVLHCYSACNSITGTGAWFEVYTDSSCTDRLAVARGPAKTCRSTRTAFASELGAQALPSFGKTRLLQNFEILFFAYFQSLHQCPSCVQISSLHS